MESKQIENERGVFWMNEKGQLHRLDGPATEWTDGGKGWWLNGINYSEEKWEEEIVKIKLKRLINEKRTSR